MCTSYKVKLRKSVENFKEEWSADISGMKIVLECADRIEIRSISFYHINNLTNIFNNLTNYCLLHLKREK